MYVHKKRVPVRIAQSGHDPLDGFFALTPRDELGPGETILGLLNSSQRVIPFIVEGDGSIILLTRINLDWVIAGERADGSLVLPPDYRITREEPVELHFMNGSAIDGMMQIEGAPTHCRASDFLNADPDFYPVITRLGTLLVNKNRVRETRLATISPGWAGPREGISSRGAAEDARGS